MKAFIYLCILLFIIIFSLYLIWLSSQKCPIKIQKFYLITLTIMLIRYLSLLSLWIVKYQKIIYIIKTLTQLTFVGMPLLSLACFYIYLRCFFYALFQVVPLWEVHSAPFLPVVLQVF